jgi:hypothetical protein
MPELTVNTDAPARHDWPRFYTKGDEPDDAHLHLGQRPGRLSGHEVDGRRSPGAATTKAAEHERRKASDFRRAAGKRRKEASPNDAHDDAGIKKGAQDP